jgi:hypothetical protein
MQVSSPAGDILEAYGIITSQQALHTYVVCLATGDNWDCHGLPNTPVPPPLCSGKGNVLLARCIEGGDEAGLGPFYPTAGVCHQIANRILFPANIRIPINHWQVRVSHLAYGPFGRNLSTMPTQNHWPDRLQICRGGGSIGAVESSESMGSKSGVLSSMNDPSSSVDQKAELSSLIKAAGLGHSVNDETLSALAKMQQHLQSCVAELGEMLSVRTISPEQYIERMDLAFREASSFGARVLGENDFHAVFGEMKVSNLFDVEQFLREQEV